jgi:MutS-like protein
VTALYEARAREHAARRTAEERRSSRLSSARLVVFLIAIAFSVWTIGSRGADPVKLSIAAGLFALFGVLVAWHARIEGQAAWYGALQAVSTMAAARIERRWDDLPSAEAPAGFDLTHHPYALDLDLFGRASLFQWLGPAATPFGMTTLADWLLHAADPPVIAMRQSAVAELATLLDWREQFAAHGLLARDARQLEIDAFLAWAESPPLFSSSVDWLVWVLTASIWILLGLFLLDVIDAALWLIPVIVGLALWFAYGKVFHAHLERAAAGQQAIGRYAQLFGHATTPAFSSPLLRDVHGRMSVDGKRAPLCMAQLNRILGFASLRQSAAIFHFAIQALTLWDFHVLRALEKWRRSAGPHVRAWMRALGDLDALSGLAGARHDNPTWCVPEIAPDRLLSGDAVGHPLIADDRRVPNDVQAGPPGTLLLVTGSNMSGKSTLLRAIGLNVVLAQAGACVCAARFRLPAADLQTSIRVQDSLELGLSYFMAALARLKGVVDAAEHPRGSRVLLYLLDEILQGTNSAERSIAVRAVARHLLDAGAIGAMTTHDLNLAAEEPLKSAAVLVHFTETVDEHGTMRFDYRLRDGIATSRNALRLMQMIGIDLKEF